MKFSWDVFFIKITSRKFWLAVGGFVSGVLTVYNFPENEIAKIVGLIIQFGSIIAYLIVNTVTDDTLDKKEGE